MLPIYWDGKTQQGEVRGPLDQMRDICFRLRKGDVAAATAVVCHAWGEKMHLRCAKKITSKDPITSPAGRRSMPTSAQALGGFLEEQRIVLRTLFSKFPARAKAFSSRHYLRTRGNVIARARMRDEDALKLVLQDLVAEPVTMIVEHLQERRQGGV
ncbi:hypothetical protein MFIFM68171_09711 [Madurella fahalii]|uniref:Uncharacterized protein n=1 Tax=Madurella fahalii TaxID=1157608 RepID=A0ABQ0GP35_9PEZI